MIQDVVWLVSATLMGAVGMTFALIAAGASQPADPDAQPGRVAYVWRGRVFWLVLIAGAGLSIGTLWTWPFAGHAQGTPAADVTIHAQARQWSWQLDVDTVRVGQMVEFEVTALDVNHGFAIYRNKTNLVAQTQAMPGYTNKLRVQFTEPGEYEVLCLEYCGLGHHLMRTVIKVTG